MNICADEVFATTCIWAAFLKSFYEMWLRLEFVYQHGTLNSLKLTGWIKIIFSYKYRISVIGNDWEELYHAA
jgi:hypothetical protein